MLSRQSLIMASKGSIHCLKIPDMSNAELVAVFEAQQASLLDTKPSDDIPSPEADRSSNSPVESKFACPYPGEHSLGTCTSDAHASRLDLSTNRGIQLWPFAGLYLPTNRGIRLYKLYIAPAIRLAELLH